MLKRKIIISIFCLLFIFVQPLQAFTSKSKKAEMADKKNIEKYINSCWWGKFNDPFLLKYIYQAAQKNQDLKISRYRILEARESVKEYFGKELPQASIGGNVAVLEPPRIGANAVNATNDAAQAFVFFPAIVSYEADIWQKNHNKTRAAKYNVESTEQDERTNYITTTTEVASAYFNILRLDKLISLQKELISLEKRNIETTKTKYNVGLAPYTDIISAEKSLKEAEIDLIEYEKQRDVFINQLYVLIGESPMQEHSLERKSIDDFNLTEPYNSISSEKIFARPDIQKAEIALKIAKINVDLARKDFLPAINLYGIFLFNTNGIKNSLNWENFVPILSASITEKIFTGGQRRARLRNQKLKYEELFQNYQKTILTSLQEVNDSLFTLKSDCKKNYDYLNELKLDQKNLSLVNTNYQQGLVSYLDTVPTRRTLIQTQQQQIQSKTNCLIDTLSLYKALGGQL